MPPNEAAGWERTVARHLPALILGYFGLHVVLRVTTPGGLGLDEAEQMVAAQSLEWGYGPQPPLYTWLQWAVFQVTGPGKLGLALLKNALLALAYLVLWAAALRAAGSRRLAAVASLSLFLLPAVAWEAQRALTHSVLAVASAAMTVLVVQATLFPRERSGDRPDAGPQVPCWPCVVALGCVAAAGLLAKPNYGFLLFGLAGALVATRRHSCRYLLALGLAAALLAPPVAWTLEHPALVARSVGSFGLGSHEGLTAAPAGLLALAEAVLAFAALMLLAHAALFWWRRPRRPVPELGFARFLRLWLVLGIAAVAAAVILAGATEVKERWLQPLLTPLPLAATLAAAPRIDAAAMRWFLGLVALLALAVLVALPLNLRYGGDDPAYQSAPFAAAAAALPGGPGLALVGDDFLAGNLRRVRPRLAVLTPEKPALDLPGAPRFAAWWSRDRPAAPPIGLVALTERLTGHDLVTLPRQHVVLDYPPPHADRSFHLQWVRLGSERE